MKHLFVIYPYKNFNVKIDLPIFYLNIKKQLNKFSKRNPIMEHSMQKQNGDIQVCVEKCAHNSTSSYWILPDTLIR
jgi:hypothetical protein